MDTVTTPPATPDTTPAVKPGYKTTEFWLSSAATFVGLLIASGIVPTTGTWPQIVGMVCALFGAMGYTVSRGTVKAAAQS